MIRDLAGVLGADIDHLQLIDQEVAELERPRAPGRAARACHLASPSSRCGYSTLTIAAHEPLGTITGWSPANTPNRVLRLLAGQVGIAAVEHRLAAAGLGLGKVDRMPQPPQDPHHRLAGLGRITSPRQVIMRESFTG